VTETVITFKTTSSEEVIASLVEEKEDYIILERARVLVMQQTPEGHIGLGMLPFMVSAENPEFKTEGNVKLYRKCIMCELEKEPPAGLVKAYLAQFSKIQLV